MKAQRLITDRTASPANFGRRPLAGLPRPTATAMPAGRGLSPARRGTLRRLAAARRRAGAAAAVAVARPDHRALPRRTQITRHDCVEGWWAIGQWTGVPLSILLDAAGLREQARFLVFHCMDRFGDRPYYESIDLDRRLPPADHPRLRPQRPRSCRSPTARRCASGSSASSATSTPNIWRGSRRWRAWPGSIAAAAAIGRIAAITNGMPGSEPAALAVLNATPSQKSRGRGPVYAPSVACAGCAPARAGRRGAVQCRRQWRQRRCAGRARPLPCAQRRLAAGEPRGTGADGRRARPRRGDRR